VPSCLSRCFRETGGKAKRPRSHKQLKRFEETFNSTLNREVQETYTASLISAVARITTPRIGWSGGSIGEYNCFCGQDVGEKRDTVGGLIDVALISKGDGFVWVKRKEPMQGFGID
jgi:hypothetical protein